MTWLFLANTKKLYDVARPRHLTIHICERGTHMEAFAVAIQSVITDGMVPRIYNRQCYYDSCRFDPIVFGIC